MAGLSLGSLVGMKGRRAWGREGACSSQQMPQNSVAWLGIIKILIDQSHCSQLTKLSYYIGEVEAEI